MICPKCRTAGLPENAENCKVCGAVFTGEERYISKKPCDFIKQIFTRKAIIATLVICVVIIALFLIFSGKGTDVNQSPEALAQSFFEARMDGDAETVFQCMPSFTLRQMAKKLGLDENASRDQMIAFLKSKSVLFDSANAMVATIESCTVTDRMTVSQAGITKEFYDMTWQEYNSIQEIAIVTIKCRAREDDGVVHNPSLRITCVQMDSKWYVLAVEA